MSQALGDLLEGQPSPKREAGEPAVPSHLGCSDESAATSRDRSPFPPRAMKPCISQATTLKNPFEADPSMFRRGGWTDVEIWLTKLESFLQDHSLAEARAVLESSGIKPVAAASQGGLLLSRGTERETHWDHFRRRLELLGELQVPTLVVVPDFGHQPVADDYERAAASLGEAAELAATFGVRLALEFQKSSPVCACLETAMALIEQSGAANAGVCLDVFHFYTGPSKSEDLAHLSPRTWRGCSSAT